MTREFEFDLTVKIKNLITLLLLCIVVGACGGDAEAEIEKTGQIQDSKNSVAFATSLPATYDADATNIYVAPNGDDANPGTLENPLQTFEGARNQVRTLLDGSKDIVVYFRGGTYVFDKTVVLGPEDSGSTNQQIVYAAYPEETPIFTSLKPVTGWSTFSGNIMVAPLPAGIDQVRFLYDQNADWLPRSASELFLATEDSTIDDGCLECNWDVDEAQPMRSNVQYPPGFSTPDWAFADQYDLRQSTISWVQEILPIERVDTSDRRIFTQIPASLEMRLNFEEAENLNRNWILNTVEGIDEPGEWANINGSIYLYPKTDTNNIYVPTLTELILVDEGTVDGNADITTPVEHIHFDGLTFRGGDFYVMKSGDITVQHDWAVVDAPTALLRFRNVANIMVINCVFEKSGSTALRFDRYAQNNVISHNRFSYLGREAILFSGRGAGYGDVSQFNEISYNLIFQTGLEKWAAPALVIDQSSNNYIHHNSIKDTEFTAIVLTAPRQIAFASYYGGVSDYLGREFHYWEIASEILDLIQSGEDEALGSYAAMDYVYNYNNRVEYNMLIDVGQGAGYLVNGYVYNSATKRGESNFINYNFVHDTRNNQVNNAVFYSDADQDSCTYIGNMISGVQNNDPQPEEMPIFLAFAMYAEGEFNEGTHIVLHGNAVIDSSYPILIDGLNYDIAGTLLTTSDGDERYMDIYNNMAAFLASDEMDFAGEIPGRVAMKTFLDLIIGDLGGEVSPVIQSTPAGTESPVGVWKKIDDRDSSISYTGDWEEVISDSAYQGTLHWTEEEDAEASYTFTGTQVRVYIWQFEDEQEFNIYLDDQLMQTVIVSPGEEGSILAWESAGLVSGTHSIQVEFSGAEFHLDAFEYLP